MRAKVSVTLPLVLTLGLLLVIVSGCGDLFGESPTATATPVDLGAAQTVEEAIGMVQDALASYEYNANANCRSYVLATATEWNAEKIGEGTWSVTAARRGPTEIVTPATPFAADSLRILTRRPVIVVGRWQLHSSGVVTTMEGRC